MSMRTGFVLLRRSSAATSVGAQSASTHFVSRRLIPVVKTTLKISSGGAAVVAAFALSAGAVDCDAVEHTAQADEEKLDHDNGYEFNPLRDTEARFLAYFRRLKVVVMSATRYIAYSSDVGESLRPVATSTFVNAMYGVSFAYVAADVAWTGYSETERGSSTTIIVRQCTHALLFQSIASIMVPSLIIHTAVDQAEKLVHKMKTGPLKRYGPSILGLMLVPLLPVTVDHPVETAVVDFAFDAAWPPPPEILARRTHEGHGHGHEGSATAPAPTSDTPTAKPTAPAVAAVSTAEAAAKVDSQAQGLVNGTALVTAEQLQQRLESLRRFEVGMKAGQKQGDQAGALAQIKQEKGRIKDLIKSSQ